MILDIALPLLFLFLLINIYIVIILKRRPSLNPHFGKYLNISVIIAAKNEEKIIHKLIDSLKKLDYPKENFEVIIIDDNSEDNTNNTISELIWDLYNFHLYNADGKEFPAKKGALSIGIKKADNPLILITDADCQLQKDWLKSYSEKFCEGNDFILGNAPLIQDDFLINKVSCFENLRSSLLSFSAAATGFPYSASARNFGFKRSSFEKIKGYSNTVETLSGDDDLLLREAVKKNLRIGTVLNDGSFAYSATKNKLTEYLNQRARHTKTSFYYLPGRQFFLAFWHLMNLFLLITPVLVFLNKFFILIFLIKLSVDLLTVKSLQKKFGYKFNFFEILYLQVIYELFLVIHFINALFKKDKWK